jgi:hypothetical protein
MARTRVLNPQGSPARADAVALSRELLAVAQAVTEPAECARIDALAGQLHGVDPAGIADDAARIAFWVNLYNALVRHCLFLKPLRGNLLWHLRLFDRIAYRVGAHDYPLNLIESGVLRHNRRAPLRLRRPLRRSDPRLAATPATVTVDPRIHFALNCGARSCPPIRAYAPESLDTELDLATRSYLEAETRLQPERRRVRLPRLMRIYAADFGGRDEQLRFAARYLPELERWLEDRRQPIRVRYGRFDWTVAAAPQ